MSVGDEVVGPRDPLAWFAQEMERRLRVNDHKPGWEDLTDAWLLHRLRQETQELTLALASFKGQPARAYAVIEEAADVANFAMMVADNARRRALEAQP